MPVQTSSTLMRMAPYFPVANLSRMVEHYELVLGFSREYVGGNPPRFAILSRDGHAIMFRLLGGNDAARICPNQKQGGTWDVFFWVDDVKALHAEMVSRGADIVYGPVFQPEYNMDEFAVRDCEGYVLGFGQAVERTS